MKAILVVDKPESCTSCLLGIYHKGWFCLKTRKDIDITDRYHIPKWCPLKTIPKMRYLHYPLDEYDLGYYDGFTRCIEEITDE